MSRAVPWSVKGVDFDAREAAKEAARRSGMPVGEWLNSVIAERAHELGIEVDDIDEDERIAAVADRVTRGPRSGRRRADPRPAHHDDIEEPRRARSSTGRDGRGTLRRSETSWDEPPRRDPHRYDSQRGFDPQYAEDSFFDAVARRIERAFPPRTDRTDAGRDDVSSRLAAIERRLEEGRAERRDDHRTSPPAAPRVAPLDLARIEAKLDMLSGAASAHAAPAHPVAAFRTSPSRTPLSQAVAEIAQRRSELDAGGRRFGARAALEPAPVARLKSEISQLSDSIAAMRAEASLAHAHGGANPIEASELKDTIATLADAVSDLRNASRAPQAPSAEIAKLQAQIADIGRTMSELAPRETVAALEDAIRELSSRVSASRNRDGMRESVVAPIEGLILDLKRSLADFAPAEGFAAISQQINAMAGALDAMAQGVVDRDLLDRVQEQTNEIHALLREAAARPVPLANVERQIYELSERMERIGERGASQYATDVISERIEAIREELQRNSPAGLVDALVARMDTLSNRLDSALSENASSPQIEALGERLENMMRDLQANFDRQRQGPLETAQLQTLVRQLSQRVEQAILSGCSPSALGVIEGQIAEILARLDYRQKDQQEPERLERLIKAMTERLDQPISSSQLTEVQETVRALVQRFDSLSEAPAALRTLERRVDDIAERLDAPVNMELDLSKIENMIEDLPRRMENARGDQAAASRFEPELIKSLESRIGAVATRLEEPVSVELDTSRLESMIADIAARLDGSRDDDGSQLQKTVDSLLERLDDATRRAPEAARLEAMMLDIAARLDRPSLNGESARQLDQLISMLAGKLGASGAEADQSQAYHAIQEQIQALAARMDGLDGAAATARLEQTVSDIFGQIDQFREAALASAELAARTVALEALTSIERNADAAPNSGVRDALTQEIAQLRAIHDASDRRTSATLNAVHETLEKVVDRLAMLETDLEGDAAQRTQTQEPAAPPARAAAASVDRIEALLASEPAPAPAPAPAPHAAESPIPAPAPEAEPTRQTEPASSFAPLSFEPLSFAPAEPEPQPEPAAQPQPAHEPAPAPEPAPLGVLEPEPVPAFQSAAPHEPPPKPEPAQHDADALDRALGQPAATAPEPPNPAAWAAPLPPAVELGPDLLLEPGSGAPTRRSAAAAAVRSAAPQTSHQSPDEHPPGSQASFIAAVRRAQQAATAAQQQPSVNAARFDGAVDPARPRRRSGGGSPQEANPSAVSRAVAFISGRKRQVLFSLAGLVLVLGALQFMRNRSAETADAPANRPAVQGQLQAPTTKLAQSSASTTPARATERATRFTTSGDFGPPPTFTGQPADRSPVASIAAGVSQAAPPLKLRVANRDLRANAAAGLPEAQFELAARYAAGKGVKRDVSAAAALFEKAAQQNLAPAQYRLGALYEKGLGVERDPQKARDLYLKAAEKGHVKAMHNLAVLLADSSLGQPDYAAAATWFRKAAEYGVRDSQYNLAILHARGLGTSQSLSESYVWFSIAAAMGDVDAGKKRADVAARLDTRQLALARANVDAFRARTPDADANEVRAPEGGWLLTPTSEPKPARPGARPRISSL